MTVSLLAKELVARLASSGASLAVAESLTGGLLSSTVVDVPGASAVFRGGVVAYATELKARLLGVDLELLATAGPVGPEVARQLATGVRLRLGPGAAPATVGLATTGVAGPEPQGDQAVGTVYIGIATADGADAVGFTFSGDRDDIRRQAVEAALRAGISALSE